jgi:hypothetical protein
MISSKNEHVFIRILSDIALHIIFDAWWASMYIGPKSSIGWDNSGHAASWQFDLHWRIQETGIHGIT